MWCRGAETPAGLAFAAGHRCSDVLRSLAGLPLRWRPAPPRERFLPELSCYATGESAGPGCQSLGWPEAAARCKALLHRSFGYSGIIMTYEVGKGQSETLAWTCGFRAAPIGGSSDSWGPYARPQATCPVCSRSTGRRRAASEIPTSTPAARHRRDTSAAMVSTPAARRRSILIGRSRQSRRRRGRPPCTSPSTEQIGAGPCARHALKGPK